MKNMNTTLEIPEGGKATIQGKVIDGKNYLVVEVEREPELKDGDLCIIFNRDYSHAFIAKYAWFLDSCYDNIIKWDGTKEQYERVLRGELK